MERRDQPADDIITTLLSADVDGEKLSEDEFDMFFLLLSVAGNETTRNSITRGMMGFFDFPDQWEKYKRTRPVRGDHGRRGRRWATPVLHFRRQCTQDYELNGVQMKAGDKVVLWHIAANRDPRAFDIRGTSTSNAPPTTMSGSAVVARTSASAPTWPAWRSN